MRAAKPSGQQRTHVGSRQGMDRGRAREQRLHQEVGRQQRILPQVAGLRLGEQVGRVHRRHRGQRDSGQRQHANDTGGSRPGRAQVACQHGPETRQHESSPHQPTSPLGTQEDVVKAPGMLQIPDQKARGDSQKGHRQQRRAEEPERVRPRERPEEDEQQGRQIRSGRDRLGPGVEADARVPGSAVGHVVAQDCGGGRVARPGVAGSHLMGAAPLLAPHEQPPFRAGRRQRVEGGLTRVLVEELRAGLLLWAPDREGILVDHLRHLGQRVVEIADQDRFGGGTPPRTPVRDRCRGGAPQKLHFSAE